MSRGEMVARVRPFWTRGPAWDPVTLGIRWFSRMPGRWRLAEVSHCGLEFCLDTADGWKQEVHESLVGTDGWRCKESRLVHRMEKGFLVVTGDWLGTKGMDLPGMYEESIRWAAFRRQYDRRAVLGLMMVHSATGRMMRQLGRPLRAGGDPNGVMCSEGMSELLFRFSNLNWCDLRMSPDECWSDCTPQSTLEKAKLLKIEGGTEG
jgi:hypothetical protein